MQKHIENECPAVSIECPTCGLSSKRNDPHDCLQMLQADLAEKKEKNNLRPPVEMLQ